MEVEDGRYGGVLGSEVKIGGTSAHVEPSLARGKAPVLPDIADFGAGKFDGVEFGIGGRFGRELQASPGDAQYPQAVRTVVSWGLS